MTTLRDSLNYMPVELGFGTSGLRGLVRDMTDLECYINTLGFIRFLRSSEGLQAGAMVYISGDLRDSTPRILRSVAKACSDAALHVVYTGLVPTPALAYWALSKHSACIMVTGSHIPSDRNGIKFYTPGGEVLKEDEAAIKQSVTDARRDTYDVDCKQSNFNQQGMFHENHGLVEQDHSETLKFFKKRYTSVFAADTLAGKKIVLYEHSSVGRDVLHDLLRTLGAEVIPVGRSAEFVSIDTENVTPPQLDYFRGLAGQYPDAFAIVSVDGDADRPFVIDERGVFHRGDAVGVLVAEMLKAESAVFPISSSDALDEHLRACGTAFVHTKIGSPYVISAMAEAVARGVGRVVGWEVNGGFLLGSDIVLQGKPLAALPTRDAFLPIVCVLSAAVSHGKPLSELFAALPQRFTSGGLIDNFSVEASVKMAARFNADTPANRRALERYFMPSDGFNDVSKIDVTDGVRVYFSNNDIAHMRLSNNAPQLRIYGIASTQARADEIAQLCLREPDGIFRTMERELQ